MYYVISKVKAGERLYAIAVMPYTDRLNVCHTANLNNAKKFASYAEAAHYKNDHRPTNGWRGWLIMTDVDAEAAEINATVVENIGGSMITGPAIDVAKARGILLKDNAFTAFSYKDGSASIFFNLTDGRKIRVALSSIDIIRLLDELKPPIQP